MEIIRTFDEQYQGVYLAQFIDCPFYNTPEEYESELNKIQDQLQDPLFVREFIKSSESGWKIGDYKNEPLTFLSHKVLQEASDLFDKLGALKKRTQNGNCFELLFDEFVELSKNEKIDDPGRRKMYTYESYSLLRLYGVRVGNNALVITGGGMKFVDTMNKTDPLKLELRKMNYFKDWLERERITDCFEF